MFEKVNPAHPDKVADRIAGAIVDNVYLNNNNPHIAVEVLLGHDDLFIIIESDVDIDEKDINSISERIAGILPTKLKIVKQDENLNNNQIGKVRCGDNGIFKPAIITEEQEKLTKIAGKLYSEFSYDGKYLIDNKQITICQSNADVEEISKILSEYNEKLIINPLGYWTGGINVDSGATNRKLGSDMGDGVSGGGLHGKDLSKADVTLNICAFLDKKEYSCSIGDENVAGIPYENYIKRAKEYINSIGGFEKFAEWGLIRP